MKLFKVAVYQDRNGNWYFRWWNVNPFDAQASPLHQGLVGPCKYKEGAEAKRRKFMEAEKQKHPWTVFESAE
jgi:hypothetical protein